MARSIPVIYNQLLAAKNAQTPLNALNSTSQVSTWNLWLWITAVGQNLFEQLCDLFTANIESQIANAPVFTPQWIVQMCKLFQYSSSSPQIVQLNAGTTYPYLTISYPVVNSSLCPVSQASVSSYTNGQVVIKVAGGSPPGPLDGAPGTGGAQCTALASYLNTILPPNVHYILINENADQLLIDGKVFYNAGFSGVIQENMNAAINNYLANIPFDGVFTVSALEEAMLSVTGVTDVWLLNVYWRRATDAVPPAAENQLVNANTVHQRNYQTYAGYVIAETTPGYTPGDLITYIPS